MISKTKISKRTENKRNLELVETVNACKKSEAWVKICQDLLLPKRNRISVNLERIDKESKDGDVVIIPGKVLSQGEITKKIRIIAFNYSTSAEEKLSKAKIDYSYIIDEIKKNPKATGVKILK
jgi:large subunit ribosomal protein L18e